MRLSVHFLVAYPIFLGFGYLEVSLALIKDFVPEFFVNKKRIVAERRGRSGVQQQSHWLLSRLHSIAPLTMYISFAAFSFPSSYLVQTQILKLFWLPRDNQLPELASKKDGNFAKEGIASSCQKKERKITENSIVSTTGEKLQKMDYIVKRRKIAKNRIVSSCRPAQHAELTCSKFDSELIPHSAYVMFFVTFAYVTFCDKLRHVLM